MNSIFSSSRTISNQVIAIVVASLLFGACQKNEDPEPEFSAAIRSNIPQETIAKLRDMGMIVNEGVKPPSLDGEYWSSPNVMTKTSVPDDDFSIGDKFADNKIKLYNQDQNKLTISLDLNEYDNDGNVISRSNGKNGAYISGKGDAFSVFVISEGGNTGNSSRFKTVAVYSGEKTSSGIRNLQFALLMLDNYGNVNQDLIPENTGRAFKDNDGISEIYGGTFRKKTDENNQRTHATKPSVSMLSSI